MAAKEKILFRMIQILFIILPFFYGMYYEFCGTVITVIVLGILIFWFLKKRHLGLSLSVGFFMGILFVACYLITIPYAVDSGIAVLGVAKVIWIPLFLAACRQLPSEKRNQIFSMVPYMGVLLCLAGFTAYFLPFLKGYFYINGRLSSGFQYANTFALFLLAGIILVCDRKEMVWKDYLSGGILLFGIVLSGSRMVFVLTCLTLLYLIIRNRNLRLAGGASFLAAIFLLYLSVPLIARYQEKMNLAIQWYPWDTEAKLALLSESEEVGKVNRLADEILQQNDTCALAYYAKAMVANCNNDYKKMIQYQKESIARSYFSHESYRNYAYMLYDGLYYAAETGDEQVYAMCKKEMEKLPSYMESAKKRLGKLGKMIRDQPDLEVDEEMREIMEVQNENIYGGESS